MRGAAHAIFWKLHTSFLKNEREKAASFLGMLEDEQAHGIDVKADIGPIHYARFEIIKENVKNGHFGRLYGYGMETPEIDPSGSTESNGKEDEFHRLLLSKEGREKLFGCLDIEFYASVVHEVEMDPYGRCDFVVREGRTWHAIEVKMGEAKSAVVSQIDKYRLAMELDMNLGLHDRVEAVVVAENFSPYVAGELSRLSVRMLKHAGTIESLRKV